MNEINIEMPMRYCKEREIKFRAKRTDGFGWAYGYFVKTPITTEFNCDGQFLDSGSGRHCIIQDGVAHEVDPDTLGQDTGLLDRNGKEIWNGDILSDEKNIPPFYGKVVWNPSVGAFNVLENGIYHWLNAGNMIGSLRLKNTEVIGNIYENPELLTQ